MKSQTQTDKLIADLLAASAACAMDGRQQHLYKQTLLSLVRLAKSEQRLDMKRDVRTAVGPAIAAYLVERPKKVHTQFNTGQQQLELK